MSAFGLKDILKGDQHRHSQHPRCRRPGHCASVGVQSRDFPLHTGGTGHRPVLPPAAEAHRGGRQEYRFADGQFDRRPGRRRSHGTDYDELRRQHLRTQQYALPDQPAYGGHRRQRVPFICPRSSAFSAPLSPVPVPFPVRCLALSSTRQRKC